MTIASMQLSAEQSTLARLALLFSVDKFRKTVELARRVRWNEGERQAEQRMRDLQRIAASLPAIASPTDHKVIVDTIDIIIDEHNRQLQTIMQRGDMQATGLFEHRLRELYALLERLQGAGQA